MKKASLAVLAFAVMASTLVVWVPRLWSSLVFEGIGFALAAAWLGVLLRGKREARRC